ncbi:Crp/Fnr family transcriptional regulator [Pedobacter yonginense]|nr:Crp/Fnr family transcriptional regulator [Pedobacter yonginense]
MRCVILNISEWEAFKESFTLIKVPAKKILLKKGQVAHHLYFVNHGILRLYYINSRGEDITAFFFKEKLFAGSYESFILQKPSLQQIEALEDTELLSISFDKLQELYKEIPKINILTRVITEQRFITGQEIFSSFILKTAEERYVLFSEKHPDLLLRVPLQYVASFLGMTAVSLSRIRRRLIKSSLIS